MNLANLKKDKKVFYKNVQDYLNEQDKKTLLRFLACGSVDDGKSTLIGRLLYDTKQIFEDQLSIFYEENKKFGTQKDNLDLALLLDGLQDEHEQGITIDVAYRYFFTRKRKFIIADVPGHEEYTKNMVTGASVSDVAIILVDARKGIRHQTQKHSFISALLGIQHIIVAINKMDLVNYDLKVFQDIKKDYLYFLHKLSKNLNGIFIPISALHGDNVVFSSKCMPWYQGPLLLEILENIQVKNFMYIEDNRSLRFPIQYINRFNSDTRGYSGTIASGNLYVGQKIKVFPSNTISSVKRIFTPISNDQSVAKTGESITIVLKDEIDVSRGNILIDLNEEVKKSQYAKIDIVWMGKKKLIVGQNFDIKIAHRILRVKIEKIQCKINVNTLEQNETNSISQNEVGIVDIIFEDFIILDKYIEYPITGSMIFIDLLTNETVGIGMIKDSKIKLIQNQVDYKINSLESDLYLLIRRHFPHWKIGNFLNET